MNVVAVVAAVRIQQWISRTTDLYLVRGASEGLSKHTGHAEVAKVLTGTGLAVAIDPHAPDIDGVVVMSASTEADAVSAVEVVLEQLSDVLPGVEWTAWAHGAASYVEAYEHVITQGLPAGMGSWHRPALGVDVPVGASCEGCAQELGTCARKRPDGLVRLGPDCDARFHSNDWTRRSNQADDFSDLAQRGGVIPRAARRVVGRRDARNHLATVAADGNRVGDLFKVLARLPSTVQSAVSEALEGAVTAALAEACETWSAADVSPVIVHFSGGDDVLASVAAPCTWQFVAVLAATFQSAFREKVKAGLGTIQLERNQRDVLSGKVAAVSLGIGVVFAHAKHPFAHTNEVAHVAMKIAKRATRGSASAISWADLTVEEGAVGGRHVTLLDIEEDLAATATPAASSRQAVLELNSSARQSLGGIVEQGRLLGAPPSVLGEHLEQWSRRTGNALPDLAAPWDQARIDGLAALLDRARWWPARSEADAAASLSEEMMTSA